MKEISAEIVGGPLCGSKITIGDKGFKEKIIMSHMNKFYLYRLRENKNLDDKTFYDYVGKK
jgi:hypothetical protein